MEEYLEEMELDVNDIKAGYVYYDNSETKWDRVCAYWWGTFSINTITKENIYYADWPGFEMERLEGSDIWRVAAPFGVENIIFNSGATDKDVSEGKVAFETVNRGFGPENIGQVYKVDMSEAPVPDTGTMKTKSRYPAGSWSDYSKDKK